MRSHIFRNYLNGRGRRIAAACLPAIAIMTLPACGLDESGLLKPNFDPGATPQSTAIICDIEQIGTAVDKSSRVCFDNAPDFAKTFAVPLTNAALALNNGRTAQFGLSKASDALSCSSNGDIFRFVDMFPQGTVVCLNSSQFGPSPKFPNADAACQALCKDVSLNTVNSEGLPYTTSDIDTFCSSHAHASTNVMALAPTGFANQCNSDGSPLLSFIDNNPRIHPEQLIWTQLTSEMSVTTNILGRLGPGSGAFDQSAVSDSTQWIKSGDAFIEFSAGETSVAHLIGLAEIPACPAPCTDTNPGTTDINYGINLGADGHYYVVEHGVPVTTGPDKNGSFGQYSGGERFRITVFDRGTGLIDVKYSVLPLGCQDGTRCNESTFYETDGVPGYPLRVDTSFQYGPATLTNVTMMRIIQ